jgi:ferredoxin
MTLQLDEEELVACVSCGLCEAACPAYAITIDGGETDRPIEREPVRFDIDMLRCILCGFCEEACPKDAIYMSDELELADYSRSALIYDIHKLKRPRATYSRATGSSVTAPPPHHAAVAPTWPCARAAAEVVPRRLVSPISPLVTACSRTRARHLLFTGCVMDAQRTHRWR